MRKPLIAVLLPSLLMVCGAQTPPTATEAFNLRFVPPEVIRDLAECKMAALKAGDWDRDSWDFGTATGQYLVACMQAKGYRRRTVGWKEAYNPMDEVMGGKKPLYRSKEMELLVKSGCYGDSNFNIAIEACWQK
jgi:hypothetical protein